MRGIRNRIDIANLHGGGILMTALIWLPVVQLRDS